MEKILIEKPRNSAPAAVLGTSVVISMATASEAPLREAM